jgi:hypothetical protein
MALPKIETPVIEIEIPTFDKVVSFRPFLVKEEKILLIAKQSKNTKEMAKAIKQVVNNCCLDSSVNIDDFAMTDLEYVFIKLRAFSVNNIVEFMITDDEDNKEYKIEVDLNKIEISKTAGLIMKYPSADMIDKLDKVEIKNETEVLNFFISKCIKTIYDEETVYDVKDYSDEEIKEFIDCLDIKTFKKIEKFFESLPKLEYTIEYKNSLDKDKKIVLDDMKDFFYWG